jgi:LAO/AO transport system kinase
VPVLAVSSLSPTTGIDELVEALDAHRRSLDLPATRTRARRLAALSEFVAEHGEARLRGLGGRREAERLLQRQGDGLGVAELLTVLDEQSS